MNNVYNVNCLIKCIFKNKVHSIDPDNAKEILSQSESKPKAKPTINVTTMKSSSAVKSMNNSLDSLFIENNQNQLSANHTSILTSNSTSTSIKSIPKKKLQHNHHNQNKSSVTTRDTLSSKASEHEPVILNLTR